MGELRDGWRVERVERWEWMDGREMESERWEWMDGRWEREIGERWMGELRDGWEMDGELRDRRVERWMDRS